MPRDPSTLPVPDGDRDGPEAPTSRGEDVLGPDRTVLVDDAAEQPLALHRREARGEHRVGDGDLVEELAVARRPPQCSLEDEEGPLVTEQAEHASDGVRRTGFERGGDGAGADVVDHRLRERSHPLPSPPCSSAAARLPGAHVEWVPLEIRSGSRSRQTGPSETRAASKTRHSEASSFMSVVNVTR